MSTDQTQVAEPGAVDPHEIDPEEIGIALDVAKAWLPIASADPDPTPAARFRAWAQEVAATARREAYGDEAQLDALEMLRRAERALGLSIRAGQRAGKIAVRGQHTFSGNQYAARQRTTEQKPSPNDWAPKGVLAGDGRNPGIYNLIDDVADDTFELAVTGARRDGNLSRSHVYRRIQGGALDTMTVTQRVERIQDLAGRGHTSAQIAPLVGVSDQRVRELAQIYSLTIPADVATRRRRGVDPERVLRESILTLQGVADSLAMLTPTDYERFTDEQLEDWIGALAGPDRALRNLTKELKAHVRDH